MRTTLVDQSKRTLFTQNQPLISTMIQTSNFSKERKHGQISKENKKTSRVISRLSWDEIQAPPKSKTPFSRIELTGRQQPRTTKCHKMWSLKRSIKIKWTILKKEAKKKDHLLLRTRKISLKLKFWRTSLTRITKTWISYSQRINHYATKLTLWEKSRRTK